MSGRLERQNSLVQHTQKELEQFQSGLISRLSSTKDLAREFYYTPDTVRVILRESGINPKRKAAVEVREKQKFAPSGELAWILGVVAGGGHVGRREIEVFSKDDAVLKEFSLLAGRIFDVNIKESSHSASFYGRNLAVNLGDLKNDTFPKTIQTLHSWVLESTDYCWKFLAGYFEVKGSIKEKKPRITFNSHYLLVNQFLADLLLQVGINRVIRLRKINTKEGLVGVQISNTEDLKTFSNHIHLVNTAKEKILEKFRGFQVRKEAEIHSEKDLLDEYVRIKSLLGYPPKRTEVRDLFKRGATKFGPHAYEYWFAIKHKEKGFIKARERIEIKLATEKALAELEAEPRSYYRPKRKYLDEQLIDEWKKIRAILGTTPTSSKIRRLIKEGKTSISVQAYMTRFGDGNFSRAKRYLEEICQEQNTVVYDFSI